jgi:hypothetical protein
VSPLLQVKYHYLAFLGSEDYNIVVIGHAESIKEIAHLIGVDQLAFLVKVVDGLPASSSEDFEDDAVIEGRDESNDFATLVTELVVVFLLEDHQLNTSQETKGND